jgi:N-acetylneuraminic acid mutarotase
LKDTSHYLTHGTNKQIFYKIYQSVEEINEQAVVKLLKEAVAFDKSWK